MKKILLLVVLGVVGWLGYDVYKMGLHTRPSMPEGAFSLSFTNGYRVIVIDQETVEPDRRYSARNFDLPEWILKGWSICRPASDDQRNNAEGLTIGHRLEAICELEIDDELVQTGILTSRPNL
ncbi:hypothetical protein AB3Y40_14585 [Yoonia sp. R2331]|uniref:hypothetical protein n=1 Tax=Yoonia sp. R2331 TaxID=3237238 RepID=UPI0034E3DD40